MDFFLQGMICGMALYCARLNVADMCADGFPSAVAQNLFGDEAEDIMLHGFPLVPPYRLVENHEPKRLHFGIFIGI